MRVLIACEESQTVCKEFRRLGHEAYSCDIQDCSGGHPEWHIKGDAIELAYSQQWDIVIAFPPCTHLTSAGAVYWKEKQKDGRQQAAIDFVMKLWNCGSDYVCIENPTGILSTIWQKPTQIINPYLFGDPYRKRTCLWLRGLPVLNYQKDLFNLESNIVKPIASWHSGSTRGGFKKDGTRTPATLPALHSSSKMRSKTFPGIARAMATQWSEYILKQSAA